MFRAIAGLLQVHNSHTKEEITCTFLHKYVLKTKCALEDELKYVGTCSSI